MLSGKEGGLAPALGRASSTISKALRFRDAVATEERGQALVPNLREHATALL